jgi:hypothetical protein
VNGGLSKMSKEELIEAIISTNVAVAADKGADYDAECIENDSEYLSELDEEALNQELKNAKLGTQFC